MTQSYGQSAQSPRVEAACKKCGGTNFHRNVDEGPSLVKLFVRDGYIDDEVIHEGDRQFTYECAECDTIFEGDE